MSGISPRRIRTKTSDIAEFFRTSHHSSSSNRSPDNEVSTQSQATTYTLDVPSTSSHIPGLTKKKSSRIPFLGRSRKKSNPSGSDVEALSARESTSDAGELSTGTAGTDRRDTLDIPEPPPSRLSTLIAPSPSRPSLGSKLVAHFQPRTRKLSAAAPIPMPEPSSSTSTSHTLAPPERYSRGASFDSGSSGRSPTPRAQPTITVSYTDNLDEYKDLFTLPRQKKTTKSESPDATPRQSNTPESSEESPSTPTSPSQIASGSNGHRRGSAPNILDGTKTIRSSKSPFTEQPPIPPPKSSKKPSGSIEKGSQDSGSTARSSDGKDSARSSTSDKLTGPKFPTSSIAVPRRVSVTPSTPAADYSAKQRLRMRQEMQETPVPVPTSASSEKRNRPPTIPLPSPPSSPTIPPTSPQIARASSASTIPTTKVKTRSRSNTAGSTSSLRSSPLSQSTIPETASPSASAVPVDQPILKTETPSIDLATATPEQLRELLIARNKQCDELASYVVTLTERSMVEKAALEKKVSQLEKEMAKKETQIKGLMWLVHNNKSPPATDFPPNLALPPSPAPSKEALPQKYANRVSTMRRSHLSDDSGAESHPTSGAESIRSSETSGNESGSLRRGKGRRPFMLGEGGYNFYKATIGKRMPPSSLAPDSALPEIPYKRSSLSSGSLSASSSTSSLLPPSPSVTVSSLSAIPESPSAKSSEYSDDRRAARASHRISTSSSSTAASSAYASNLKRSRPPSIAQVLENSPNMDDVLEKLRPFQPTS